MRPVDSVPPARPTPVSASGHPPYPACRTLARVGRGSTAVTVEPRPRYRRHLSGTKPRASSGEMTISGGQPRSHPIRAQAQQRSGRGASIAMDEESWREANRGDRESEGDKFKIGEADSPASLISSSVSEYRHVTRPGAKSADTSERCAGWAGGIAKLRLRRSIERRAGLGGLIGDDITTGSSSRATAGDSLMAFLSTSRLDIATKTPDPRKASTLLLI